MKLKFTSLLFFLLTLLFGLFFTQSVFASFFDPTYGTNGMTQTSFGNFFTYGGERMDLQPDGKPVVVGFTGSSTDSNTWNWRIARYTIDGFLDTTFGNNGSVDKDFGRVDNLSGVKVQSDGKIVVGGVSQLPEEDRSTLTLARYNADGTLDTTFGDNGIVRNFAGTWSSSNRIDIQQDGKIISVGSIVSSPDYAIIDRYNSDGSPDSSFGSNGLVTVSGRSVLYSVIVQPDGKILAGGQVNDHPTLVRLNGDGSFDTTFGNNGIVVVSGLITSVEDVAFQSDGKVVASGGGGSSSYVWRFNSDGSVDNTFANNGVYTDTLGSAQTIMPNMYLQPDGAIVLSGNISNTNTNEDQFISAIIRLTSNGALDPGFGNNGVITADIVPNGYDSFGPPPVVDAEGRLLIAGLVMNSNGFRDWLIARITATDNATPTPTPPDPGYTRFTVTGYDSGTGTFTATSTVSGGVNGGNGDWNFAADPCSNIYLYLDNSPFHAQTNDTELMHSTSVSCTASGTDLTFQSNDFINLGSYQNIFVQPNSPTNFSASYDFDIPFSSPTPTVTPTPTPTPTATPTPAPIQLSALSPAKVWVGLKNSDDVGTKFDLKVEAYKDSTLVSSGELDSFTGGSSGFNNAHLATISFDNFSPVDFPAGSVLGLKVYVRNACVGSAHNSGTARLWFNDSQANSQFGATIASNSSDYFLRDLFALATTTGSTKKTIDIAAGAKCSPFKPFGTWTITP